MNQQQTIEERVERGAKFMDALDPNWASRINLENLLITAPRNCVIGQYVRNGGEYEMGMFSDFTDAHNLTQIDIANMGFDMLFGVPNEAHLLEVAWAKAVDSRLHREQ